MAYQLSPFEAGQVKAHMEHGLSAASIAKIVYKADGETLYGATAIQNCMNHLTEDPAWRGERKEGSARPRKTTKKQDKKVVKWLLKNRGKEEVGVARLKKEFPFLRPLSNTLTEDPDKSIDALTKLRSKIKQKRQTETTI